MNIFCERNKRRISQFWGISGTPKGDLHLLISRRRWWSHRRPSSIILNSIVKEQQISRGNEHGKLQRQRRAKKFDWIWRLTWGLESMDSEAPMTYYLILWFFFFSIFFLLLTFIRMSWSMIVGGKSFSANSLGRTIAVHSLEHNTAWCWFAEAENEKKTYEENIE